MLCIAGVYSCNNLLKTNDVVVTLTLAQFQNVQKVEFYKDQRLVKTVKQNELSKNSLGEFVSASTKLEFSYGGSGEHTCKICVFTLEDTLCTELYTEGGYRPELTFDRDTLIIKEFTGGFY